MTWTGLTKILSRASFAILVFFGVAACSVYGDSPFRNVGIEENSAGANAAENIATDSVTDSADAGKEVDSRSSNNVTDVDVCGDGRVTGTETCDTKIDLPNRDSCLFPCMPIPPCFKAVLEGTPCHTTGCLFAREQECKSGDGCCPDSCTPSTDSDCSTKCGDGVVQSDQGETCEPANAFRDAAVADAAVICPTKCTFGGDPCTTLLMSGNPEKCNVRCVPSNITALINGDGCCPKGADANSDSDCLPICGNGIREADEECDGDSACDGQCKSLIRLEQRACFDSGWFRDLKVEDECNLCMCTNCGGEIEACNVSASQDLNKDCVDIVRCGYRSRCLNAGCYCGTESSGELSNCSYTAAKGACKDLIVETAGTTNIVELVLQATDVTTALGKSMALGNCFEANCINVCYPNNGMAVQ